MLLCRARFPRENGGKSDQDKEECDYEESLPSPTFPYRRRVWLLDLASWRLTALWLKTTKVSDAESRLRTEPWKRLPT